MHDLESVLENETLKIHWGFELQTDYLILARKKKPKKKPKEKKEKKTCWIVDFAFPVGHSAKKKKRKES